MRLQACPLLTSIFGSSTFLLVLSETLQQRGLDDSDVCLFGLKCEPVCPKLSMGERDRIRRGRNIFLGWLLGYFLFLPLCRGEGGISLKSEEKGGKKGGGGG